MGKKHKSKKSDKEETFIQRRQPKIVDHVFDSDDEEIPEDEAFNSEDERLYGHFFNNEDEEDENIINSDESDSNETMESDEEEDDGGQYMLSLLDKLDTSTKNKNDPFSRESGMMNIPESEYSSSISNKNLTLDNLMDGLQDTHGFRDLQKTFQKRRATTPAPMEKVKADREQRKIAYQEQVKNIAGWTKVVQENRQADTLDFKPKERMEVTRDTLIEKFEPKSEFEKDLEQALEVAGQEDEGAVLKAEEKALQDDLGSNRLTMDEYKERRGQLAQIRALMFYHEQKRHHMKKIKSKKYRRIRKKQRERLKESALEAAMEEDDDFANELKKKEELSRIQERMTLAHKNTSKWAKRILKRGKNVDMDTRRALSAQLKRGDDLRRKMLDNSDKTDSDSDEEDLIESARKVVTETEAEAGLSGHEKTGLFKLSFMQKGLKKQRDMARTEARNLLSELQANEFDGVDEIGSTEDIEGENIYEMAAIATKKEMHDVFKEGEYVATSLEFGNSNAIATTGGVDIDLSLGDASNYDSQTPGSLENEERELNSSSIEYTSSTLAVKNAAFPKDKAEKARGREIARKNKVGKWSKPVANTVEETSNPWMQSSESEDRSSALPVMRDLKMSSRNAKRRMIDVDAAVNILDAGKEESNKSKSKVVKQEGVKFNENRDKKQMTTLTQEELVRMAFATPVDKEAEDEFQREKEKLAAESDPTRKVNDKKISKESSGWGSWAGMGAPTPCPRKLPKKLSAPVKQKVPSRKRKDDKKPDIIINQKRLKKTANGFMLGDVPHPFSSRYEYEQAMIGGVGREWNVSSSFRNATRPDILTRPGKIIQPISKRTKAPRAPAKF
jgi:U3 small nucleolar RNA-associated protein 14